MEIVYNILLHWKKPYRKIALCAKLFTVSQLIDFIFHGPIDGQNPHQKPGLRLMKIIVLRTFPPKGRSNKVSKK